MDDLKDTLKELNLTGTRGKIAAVLSICTSLFFLYTSCTGSFPAMIQRGVLLAFTMPLIFLVVPRRVDHFLVRSLDYICILTAPIPFIYIICVQDQLMMRGGIPNKVDVIMGILATVIILEATRRRSGWALPILALLLLLYGFLGPAMPGILSHRGLDLDATITALFLGEEGIFGIPVAVTANFIMIFILFGAFLQVTGAGEFFIELATALCGWMRGGPAKVAVVGSSLMGMVSGSAVANVATVGTFTIPLMKKIGYKPEVAGGIEAVGSSGGQIMPPIMGAAAFIMADFLKMPYFKVAVAAIIPAILYYLALFFMVDLEAAKTGLKGLPRNELPDWKKTFLKSGYLLLPIFGLIYLLGFVQYSPQKAAFFTIVLLWIISCVRPHTRLNLKKFVTALINGAIGGLEVAAVCACAGIVIGIVMRTGLGLSLTGVLIELSGGILPILMVLTMLTSTILGMGLPTSACYIIVAVLVAPAMVKIGVLPIAAHMFAFYYATLSAITPPVALAAYAAAGIAKATSMKTGLAAFGFGLTGFIVPFMFVYGPPLLMQGPVPEIILCFAMAALGTYSLAMSMTGMWLKPLHVLERITCFAAALFLIIPEIRTDIIGLILLAAVMIINFRRYRRESNISLSS
ncbi:MAG: TRAP transporter permease [Armatimonadetes bacterium]|nr:TRAP transporter permease [Armatimonadota bacterium]